MSFTILIQGPLNEISLKNINNYLKFGKVVISHWYEDDTSLLELIDPSHLDSKSVAVCGQYMPSMEEWEPTWYGDALSRSTFPWAVKSTYYGLQNVDTEFVIKVRSDEMFEDLNPIIDLFLESKKMVFGNIYAYKFNSDPYKLGDHIFVDYTDKLVKAYEKIIESDEFRYPTYCAEHILMINYMRANYGHMSGDIFEHRGGYPFYEKGDLNFSYLSEASPIPTAKDTTYSYERNVGSVITTVTSDELYSRQGPKSFPAGKPVHQRSGEEMESQLYFCKMAFECIDLNLLKDFILCPRENNFSSKEKGYWDSPGVVKNTKEFFS
jgi:hypothetical protein